MKHTTKTRTIVFLIAGLIASAGYVVAQVEPRLSIKITHSLLDSGNAGADAYAAHIKATAENPAQVSEALRVARAFPQHAPLVLLSLQVEQNAVLIEQNKRIIALLEAKK